MVVVDHEAHVPTQRHQAQAHPRFPRADGDAQWSQGDQPASRPRPQAPVRLKGPRVPDRVARDTAFGRTRRLTTKADYDRVFSGVRIRLRRHPFTLLAGSNDRHGARLGLVVSRRSARRAVDRNRIKRQARETFRTQLLPGPDVDIVLLSTQGAGSCDAAQLRDSLEWLWRRLQREMANEEGGETR